MRFSLVNQCFIWIQWHFLCHKNKLTRTLLPFALMYDANESLFRGSLTAIAPPAGFQQVHVALTHNQNEALWRYYRRGMSSLLYAELKTNISLTCWTKNGGAELAAWFVQHRNTSMAGQHNDTIIRASTLLRGVVVKGWGTRTRGPWRCEKVQPDGSSLARLDSQIKGAPMWQKTV